MAGGHHNMTTRKAENHLNPGSKRVMGKFFALDMASRRDSSILETRK